MSEGTLFYELQEDLKPYLKLMGQATDTILSEDVSKYPIIVAARESIEIGIPLLEQPAPEVNLHASTLEEFVTKRLIQSARVDRFREVYKNPGDYLCVFLIAPPEGTFIFIPRGEF